MNAVEIDVGNLKNWLNGTIPGSGNLVDFQFQNGYVLYFSDRRGMLPNPNGTAPVGAPRHENRRLRSGRRHQLQHRSR